MLIIRRILLYSTLIVTTILLVLWLALHFFAPNPTHRWYSSELVNTTSFTNTERGIQGEELLAQDLGLDSPTNERSDNTACICNTRFRNALPSSCNQCVVYTDLVSNYRIPDFVTSSYIADSKNRYTLLNSDTDIGQVREMAEAAKVLGIPLYLYVRVNTAVDQSYYELARSTGGDVIQYFLVDGYENRLMMEQAVNYVLIAFLVLGAGALAWAFIANNRPHKPSDESDLSDSARDTESKIEETEEFIKRLERLSKQSKDNDEKKGKP